MDILEFTKANFRYCANRGWLINTTNRNSRARIGCRAGHAEKHGYRRVRINGKPYMEHHLIWILNYNEVPKLVDHIDGNPSNNLISNLRKATPSQNQHNSKIPKNNKSGYKGVRWCSQMKKWRAVIGFENKLHQIGYFDSAEEASAAYQAKALELHGEFTRK